MNPGLPETLTVVLNEASVDLANPNCQFLAEYFQSECTFNLLLQDNPAKNIVPRVAGVLFQRERKTIHKSDHYSVNGKSTLITWVVMTFHSWHWLWKMFNDHTVAPGFIQDRIPQY